MGVIRLDEPEDTVVLTFTPGAAKLLRAIIEDLENGIQPVLGLKSQQLVGAILDELDKWEVNDGV